MSMARNAAPMSALSTSISSRERGRLFKTVLLKFSITPLPSAPEKEREETEQELSNQAASVLNLGHFRSGSILLGSKLFDPNCVFHMFVTVQYGKWVTFFRVKWRCWWCGVIDWLFSKSNSGLNKNCDRHGCGESQTQQKTEEQMCWRSALQQVRSVKILIAKWRIFSFPHTRERTLNILDTFHFMLLLLTLEAILHLRCLWRAFLWC